MSLGIFLMNDEDYMREALKEAEISLKEGNIPIGCVIVRHNKIISGEHNQIYNLNDRQATIYTTYEPYPMCLGAIILSSYINYDIASLMDFKKSEEAYKLIKLLAVRIGTRLEISKISILTGMSRYSVENYLQLFEQSYLIRTIPVTATSPDREIVKANKLYFLDNGIASMSAELSSGAKFENAVFNQLHHFGEVSYYALKTGNEIDFILDKKSALEVKETPTEAHLKNVELLFKNIGADKCYVVGRYPPARIFPGFVWGGTIRPAHKE